MVSSGSPQLPPSRLSAWTARLSGTLAEAALALVGLRPFAPLPPPRPLAGEPPATVTDLWDRLPRPTSLSRSGSGLWTTVRAIRGDLVRKQLDQVPGLAGQGEPPPGFATIEAPAVDRTRAPLFALFHPPQPGRPIVFVLHGLFDSKLTGYVRRAAVALAADGVGVVVPDLRWHGRLLSAEWLPGMGVPEAADILAWATGVAERNPSHPLGLLGFSLGTMTLIHALASPEAPRLFSAGGIAVSSPGAPRTILPYLDQTGLLARPLGRGLMPMLFRLAMRQRLARVQPELLGKPPFCALVEQLVASEPNETSPAEVLAARNPLARLPHVRRPLLLVSSQNDPIFPSSTLTELAAAATGNPWVRLEILPGGGHVGQMGVDPRWAADLLKTFFSWAPRV